MPLKPISRTIDQFIQVANNLPNTELIHYELNLTKYISKNLKEADFEILLEWFKEKIENNVSEEVSEKLHFTTFFALCIYSRRMKNFTVYFNLIQSYGHYFEEQALYPHILSLYHKLFNSAEHMDLTIEYARQAVQNSPKQIGVLHNYVEAIVTAKENKLNITESLWEDAQVKMKEIGKHMLYARFHATRGRLLALLGEFTGAKLAIHKAIDEEDSTTNDYSIRINEYQSQLLRIQTLETSSVIISQLEKTKDELEHSKQEISDSMEKLQKDNLQFLGFFVAIITLTIGSLNLIGDKSFLETALLMLVLTGCIILGYISLGLIFHPKNSRGAYRMLVMVICFLLIIGSIAFQYILSL